MKRSAIPIMSICTALILGSIVACKPDATPRAVESKKWLDDFYTHNSIRGGWGYFGSEAKDKNVVLSINVPERQEQDLMKFEEGERKRFIGKNACPPAGEDIWSKLDEGGDIIVQTRLNGNIFAEVPCRIQIKGY